MMNDDKMMMIMMIDWRLNENKNIIRIRDRSHYSFI